MENLPKVSIVTPTYNKKTFLSIAIQNFLSFDYPKDKLEWIILDDSDESVRDILPNDSRIKYYYYDQKSKDDLYKLFIDNYNKRKSEYKNMSKKQKKGQKYKLDPQHKKHFKGNRIPVGMKRNICAQYATSNYIIHMDDDDFYPPKSILTRVNALMKNGVDCVGCSSIGCFHINKMISLMYIPDKSFSPAKKISVATLAYTKQFWEKHRFENQDMINEGEFFLKKRKCDELHWKDIIVALYHSKNDRNLKSFQGDPNGWHYYPLSDELFTLITSMDPDGDNISELEKKID
jgi:glycosyltransferase involved in cell wall biosynthesis